ncbi:MAG: adenylyl-sulfate kinase [Rhodospirillaceae bacterium]
MTDSISDLDAKTEEQLRALAGPVEAGILRFITCGSVDDGKSTLIGRLLHDCGLILDDQMDALRRTARRSDTADALPELADLLDGLQAEREQGITIDVAYRYFATKKRKFIVADTPGHERYTRNMATGASNADVAILLVDARKGPTTQTHRHAVICSLMGIPRVMLAVNKMDAIDWDLKRFEEMASGFRSFAEPLGFTEIGAMPVSALTGAMVAHDETAPDTLKGQPTLLSWLESVPVRAVSADGPLRFPVQWVNRPNQDFRGMTGTLRGGSLTTGERIKVLPSGEEATVARILAPVAGATVDVERAVTGQAITVTLAEDVDASRGDMLVRPEEAPTASDHFEAKLVWMAETPMPVGRHYLIKCGTRVTGVEITALKARIDVNTLEEQGGKSLALNEIGLVTFATERPLIVDPYAENRETGAFILIDPVSGATLAAGMIESAMRRGETLFLHDMTVSRQARARQKGQRACVLWFTGLSGAGKSTIADAVDRKLFALGRHVMVLDGDAVRHGLNKDLGFADAERVENIRRVSEVARLGADAGLIVMTAFISPFQAERQAARNLMEDGAFLEIFVDAPLEECERRDPNGLYAKARNREITNFTGIDSPYEPPESPDLHLHTDNTDVEDLADQVIAELTMRGII